MTMIDDAGRPRGLAGLLHEAHADTPRPVAEVPDVTSGSPAPAPVHAPPTRRGQILIAGLVAAGLLWGVWATHAILDLKRGSNHLVKVQLADLVREYVQTEARSGAAPEQITAQTAGFLKALNAAVNAHAKTGEIVLLSNAVVDGAVPDITAAIRSEVYASVPRTAAAPARGPSPQMEPLFQKDGGPGGSGQ